MGNCQVWSSPQRHAALEIIYTCTMRKLFLIRHARPEIMPGTPARSWTLAPADRAGMS